MHEPCKHCGYMSDRPARFCRQCGSPLFNESEASSADTRNYGRQSYPSSGGGYPADTDPNRPYTSQNAPYGSYGSQGIDTSRFYQPPAMQNYGVPEKKHSGARTWIIVIFALLLLAGGAMTFLFSTFVRSGGYRNRGVIVETGVLNDIERDIEDRIREHVRMAEEQARVAEERAREAQEAMPKIEGVPAPPLPPAAPGSNVPTSLEKYKYPNAEIHRSASFIGNEFIEMTTNDDVAKVSEFYNNLVGRAALKTNDADGVKVVYQIPGSPSILVAISPDDETPGKTQIAVFKSRIRIPRLNIDIR